MGQGLRGSATTTEVVRRVIQDSQESLRALAKRHWINQKTVAKWKQRTFVADVPTGRKSARSTVLPVEEEVVVIAFRRNPLRVRVPKTAISVERRVHSPTRAAATHLS